MPNFRYSIFSVVGLDLDGTGKRVAAGYTDKKLCVHDVESGALVRAFDVRSGQEVQRFVGHSDNVYAIRLHARSDAPGQRFKRHHSAHVGYRQRRTGGATQWSSRLRVQPGVLAGWFDAREGSGDTTVRIWDTVPLHERWHARTRVP